ncbi:Cullin-associated NEDD8-dissociated protein 1 N-terminal part [Penicillium taxi]|uniref:Cullin-associated NEDD8-dissociated protein 1 N-terminal part n=1 Tax=Penicillium taxi TaxID=168475 RepID=UPI002544DF74|nr:Cullin-associated NEDD8-dissociated protein 1 N-terminal part [Penicillium taxi]KAJ5894746.1 Cullin-associated NEDD8-dissociated protein 1 N-terminal part [Penicillium taxi]
MSMAEQNSIKELINKHVYQLGDPDADLRYMALNDLSTLMRSPTSNFLTTDRDTSTILYHGIIKALEDQNGDVQNQALECLAPLAPRMTITTIFPLIQRLADLTTSSSVDSLYSTALRTVIESLPRPQIGQPAPDATLQAYKVVCEALLPKLTGSGEHGMLVKDPSKGFRSDALEVLIATIACFGPLLKKEELDSLTTPVVEIINNETSGTVVTKRALTALSALVQFFSDKQLADFLAHLSKSLSSPAISTVQRSQLIATVGAIAKNNSAKIGPHLTTLVPFVFAAVDEQIVA